MTRLLQKYWIPVEKDIDAYFWEMYYAPIMEIVHRYFGSRINSISQLLDAIRSGRIRYSGGKFTGSFNIAISRTLSQFATFDSRSKTWVAPVANVPSSVKGAAVTANARAETLVRDIRTQIDLLEQRVAQTVENLALPFRESLVMIDGQLRGDISKIKVVPNMSTQMIDNLYRDYNTNQQLYIKKWSTEQTERLRAMIEKVSFQGIQRNTLRDAIAREWKVSQNKAKFLARQESSLFLSKLRRERALDAGIRRYRWSTSNDERVRPADGTIFTPGPNHRRLNNNVYTFGDPPIVDTKTGRRAEPGEDYNCRCVAIFVA